MPHQTDSLSCPIVIRITMVRMYFRDGKIALQKDHPPPPFLLQVKGSLAGPLK